MLDGDRGNLANSGVGIHHPDGSAKKISTYTSNLSSTTYNGGAFNAHWNVYWTSTTNGHGVTEGGSSVRLGELRKNIFYHEVTTLLENQAPW